MKRLFLSVFLWLFGIGNAEDCFGQLIDGYTDKISYYSNEKVKLYLNYKQSSREVVYIYDASGKLYFTLQTKVYPQKSTTTQPWKNGFDYTLTCEFELRDFKPGFYQIEKEISFVVKSDSKKRVITIVYPSNTINAYSNSGGKSLYKSNSTSKESDTVVSFLRPMNSRDANGNSTNFNVDLFSGVYKWLNENLLINDLTNYISDQDLENKSILDNSKLLIIVGHSEYWTRNARKNFDDFILKGNNALIMSGNTMWWQVRFKNNNQQLICYRSVSDPIIADTLKTIEWFKKQLNYPIESSSGLNFNNGGYGLKKDKGWDGFKIIKADHPIFNNTKLKNGSIIPCPSIEYDGIKHSGFSEDSIPIVDTSFTNRFYRYELLGFDRAIRNEDRDETIGAFVLTQKNPSAGQVIHIGSTDWCKTSNFYGVNKTIFQMITNNCIYFLLPDLTTVKEFVHNKPLYFPNPSSKIIFLNQSDYTIVKIRVIDEKGNEVQVADISSSDFYFNFPIELKGLFFLTFELIDGTVRHEKIMLN